MFWRGVLGYLPVNVAQGLVGLLTIVTFTRLLSPEQYGAYAVGFSVMSLTHTLLFTWIEAAQARFWARANADGEVAPHMATLLRAWGLLALVFPIVAGLILWLAPLSLPIKQATAAGLAAVLVRTLCKLGQERRRAAGDVSGAAMLDIVQTVGAFAIGAVLALFGAGGAAPLIGAGAIAALCLIWVLPKDLPLAKGGHFEPKRARAYAAYGLPISLSLILALVIASTDRFLLAAFMDETAVGVYHAGYSLANRTLDVLFMWLGMAGGPAMVMALERGGERALREAAREQSSFMVLLTLPAAVGLALVAHPLAEVMVGEQLREGAAHVVPWIVFGGFCAGMTTYYLHEAFTLGRRTHLLFAAMIIPAGANVALNLVLIPRFGIDGAMYATAASYLLGAGASFALGRGSMSLPIPTETIWKAGLSAAAMAVAVMQVPAVGGVFELLAKAAVGAAVYGAGAFLLDAGGLRSRGPQLIHALRARAAS